MLFGRPNDQTGLTAAQCQPSCGCGSAIYIAPDYSDAFIDALETNWTLLAAYPPLTVDPYASPAPPTDLPDSVCGVLPLAATDAGPRPYALVTYPSETAAYAAGASPTNFGHCGLCSTLANLAVYMRVNDLTAPVRACGLNTSTEADNIACLQAIGFDLPCAQIYYYNTANTRSVCLSECLAALGEPYNLPDGGLNACLQCDEDRAALFSRVSPEGPGAIRVWPTPSADPATKFAPCCTTTRCFRTSAAKRRIACDDWRCCG